MVTLATMPACLPACLPAKVTSSCLSVDSLENLREEVWGDRVTVVAGDMRVWSAPELADIIVSELLGSFGDNELSPECLDGAQKFLKGTLAGALAGWRDGWLAGWLVSGLFP